jgi:hypothetical protein
MLLNIEILNRNLTEAKDIYNAFREDYQYLIEAFKRDHDNPIIWRLLIRTGFTYVESSIFYLQQVITQFDRLNLYSEVRGNVRLSKILQGFASKPLSVEETSLVANILYRYNPVERLKKLLKLFTKYFHLEKSTDFSCLEWRLLHEAYLLRNHLTHPKDRTPLDLDLVTVKGCVEGIGWYVAEFTKLQQLFVIKSKVVIKQMAEFVDERKAT